MAIKVPDSGSPQLNAFAALALVVGVPYGAILLCLSALGWL